MKNIHLTRTSALATATKALVTVLITASSLTLFRTPGRAEEIFPTLVIKGQVYTNVSVVRTNPAEVILRWEGGNGGTFKRQDLPPEVAARYPYDPKAAEKWANEKAVQDRESAKAAAALTEQKRAQQRERTLQDLQRKEADLKAQISKGKKQVKDMDEVIKVLDGKAKGTRRRSVPHQQADGARNQKLRLLDQVHQLEEQLSAVQDQISRYH
jgi:hypothetical protein